MRINYRLIGALCRRDLRLYFSNPTGYVFITLFIFLSAAAAFWQERFFLNNLANLDQLNNVFPYLLLFFVPAITMGVWADERKQGTEELLLTLPATDLEIVLGKYLSTLGIYTAALALSVSHLVVLFWLGSPDLGLMFSNYIGYWMVGAAFISVGMLASLLSSNATIAFILGAIFCGFFVYVEPILGVFGDGARSLAEGAAVFRAFGDFAGGVVSFSGLVYFASVVGTMLYLNVVLLGRRHWPQEADGYRMWVHVAARIVSVVIAVAAFSTLMGRTAARADLTAGKLHSLSKETRRLLKDIPEDRPVLVQAYISKDVPKAYAQTRATLVGLLREIDATAGRKVEVLVHDTEPFSQEARDARDKFGIQPVDVPNVGARAQVEPVFMGVAFTCGAEEDVIPFFDRGLPTEYELARSIRVVARTHRKKIGVLNTQLNVFGGFDFNTYQTKPAWGIVDELKKQYEVVRISATDSISGNLDGLLVTLPSSLSQEEMDVLADYIERGTPTLLLVDPVPVVDVGLSPTEESGANVNPFMRGRGPQPKPKGDINAFMTRLGIRWNPSQVLWDAYNPHPDLASLPPEIVFIGQGNQNPESFNAEVAASAGLQELVFLYPGLLGKAGGSSFRFEPLVNSGDVSGTLNYRQLVQRSFFGVQLAGANTPHYPTKAAYTIAAWVRNSETPEAGAAQSDPAGAEDKTESKDKARTGKRVNVIVVADIDFISEQFFQIRRLGVENLRFDNISFFLNCIDALVGDESFIALRNRRVKHRTLATVEARTRAYAERRAEEERQARMEAQQALAEAQQRLNEKVAEVQQRTDLDAQTKQIMSRNLQEVENRRLDALKASIDAERDMKIQRSKEDMEAQIRRIESNIKTLAGLLPPIPVFAMGIMIFLRRQRREREGAAAVRRLRRGGKDK